MTQSFDAPIKDSGARTEFLTGAVRDVQTGKGRFDLLPPAPILYYLSNINIGHPLARVLTGLYRWLECRQFCHLQTALDGAADFIFLEACSAGSTTLTELAKHFEKGAEKYAARNWEKGIPLSRFFDSAARHLTKAMAGHTDEPHAVAGLWNIVCLYQTLEWIQTGILPEELNDLPVYSRLHPVDVRGGSSPAPQGDGKDCVYPAMVFREVSDPNCRRYAWDGKGIVSWIEDGVLKAALYSPYTVSRTVKGGLWIALDGPHPVEECPCKRCLDAAAAPFSVSPFKSEEAAIEAYKAKAEEIYGKDGERPSVYDEIPFPVRGRKFTPRGTGYNPEL